MALNVRTTLYESVGTFNETQAVEIGATRIIRSDGSSSASNFPEPGVQTIVRVDGVSFSDLFQDPKPVPIAVPDEPYPMNVTQFLEEIRDILDDPDGANWGDKELIRTANRICKKMIRKQAQVNEGYHNATVVIAGSAAVKQHQDVFDYLLPPWVLNVVAVREDKGGTVSEGPLIQHIREQDSTYSGWFWEGQRTIRLKGYNTPLDLEFRVAKLPAAVTRGTTPWNAPQADQLYLMSDTDANLEFPNELIDGAFINGLFMMTGVDTASHKITGKVVRCVSQQRLVDPGGGTLNTLLTFDESFKATPATNDTYEMVFEIPDEHTRLLVLAVARSSFIKKGNQQMQGALRAELDEELLAYVNHIQPRQMQEPDYFRSGTSGRRGPIDIDSVRDELA